MEIDGETVTDFIFLGSKIIANGDCSHEIKRRLPLEEKFDQSRQHIKKQKHYFGNKGPSSQSYGFSSSHVWMWELDCEESWAPKNDAFELWCWRRLLRVPWTARRSNQSILSEISPGISLEGKMLKLKLLYFGHLMRRVDSLEKTLMLEGLGAGGKGTTEDEMAGWHHRLNRHEFEQTPGDSERHGCLACCRPRGPKESDTTEQLKWTELNVILYLQTSWIRN